MYSRILFAIDDDDALPAAVPVVVAYAKRWGATVRVLHVQPISAQTPEGADRGLVRSVVDRLETAGVAAEGEVRLAGGERNMAAVITRAAKQAEADLVAIGSHGRSDLGALFLGSVSHAVAAGLDAPVLVLRASAVLSAEPRMVLVAVDGSATSDEAVAEAADVASAFGAEVLVVHVQQVVTAEGAAILEPLAEAQATVDRAVAALRARGIQATGKKVVDHSVAAGVVTAAEEVGADLVVLGSRRPGNVSGLLLGSVAHSAINRLRRPVLLARRVGAAEPVA